MALHVISEVIFLVLLSATVQSQPRVNCFVCSWSFDDEPCGDAGFALVPEQSNHYMINCSVCYKQVKIGASGEKKGIIRGCVQNEWAYLSKCQSIGYEGGLSWEICACREDYCNNAPTKILANPAFCILALSVALVVVRLRV